MYPAGVVVGNNANGIGLTDSSYSNTIGGINPGEANVIVNNLDAGIAVVRNSINNKISGNIIYGSTVAVELFCGDGICSAEIGEDCRVCPEDCGRCHIGCSVRWECGEWGECINGIQTRTCENKGTCSIEPKTETQECIVPIPAPIPAEKAVPFYYEKEFLIMLATIALLAIALVVIRIIKSKKIKKKKTKKSNFNSADDKSRA